MRRSDKDETVLLSDEELADLVDDLILLSPEPLPSCQTCRHFDRLSGLRCAAFPRGIPQPILDGQVDHRHPLPGDRGIQYERRLPSGPETDPVVLEARIKEQLTLRERLGLTSVPETRRLRRVVA